MRIGTRRSPLAIAQAEEVGAHLSEHGMEVELVPMTTSGDEGAAPDGGAAGTQGPVDRHDPRRLGIR